MEVKLRKRVCLHLFLWSSRSYSSALGSRPQCERLSRPRTAAIRVSTRLRVLMPCSALQAALETTPLVFRRSCTTRPESTTRPMVLPRCLEPRRDSITRPPVTLRYKKGIDPQRIPQFGLVAEDVEAVNPDLVVRDEEGKLNTVRYDAVNAMLLNEFLKEHRKVEELSSMVAEQRKEVNALAAAVKEQAAQVQKVSAQVELSKAEPQMVVNKQ